jgi:hypothetical protein
MDSTEVSLILHGSLPGQSPFDRVESRQMKYLLA